MYHVSGEMFGVQCLFLCSVSHEGKLVTETTGVWREGQGVTAWSERLPVFGFVSREFFLNRQKFQTNSIKVVRKCGVFRVLIN